MIHYISHLATQVEEAKSLINLLKEAKVIGLDVETNGLDPYTSIVLLLQLQIGEHTFIINRGGLGINFAVNIMKLINDNNIICIGHNIKFDAKMLRHDTGIWLKNVYDTMVVETILSAGISGKRSSLQELINKYFDVYIEKSATLEFLTLNHSSTFTERQITYAATDVFYLLDLREEQLRYAKEANLLNIVALESNLLMVVAEMEYVGILVDVEHHTKLTQDVEEQYNAFARKLKSEIFDTINSSKYDNAFKFAQAVHIPVKTKRLTAVLESITDATLVKEWIVDNFNLASHPQVLSAINLCGIKAKDTNEKTLNKLPSNKILDLLFEYRDYEKRLSCYGYNIIKAINPVTRRLHADYNQVGTSTGRFSSSGGVNMQNIPTHNGYRESFVSKPGFSLIAMDYSQCEYRLAGALSKEEAIIYAYMNGYDMHTASGANRYGIALKDVTKEQRDDGKSINFTVLYGGTEFALGKNLRIPTEEAKSILRKFFIDYPRLALFKQTVENMIVKHGYSITPMGRKRYFKTLPAFATAREVVNNEAKTRREGFNMVIQGGTADVLKVAMVNIARENPFGDNFYLLLQIHDELVAEVEDTIIEEAAKFMEKRMLEAFQPLLGEIPAKVDRKVSKRWTKS